MIISSCPNHSPKEVTCVELVESVKSFAFFGQKSVRKFRTGRLPENNLDSPVSSRSTKQFIPSTRAGVSFVDCLLLPRIEVPLWAHRQPAVTTVQVALDFWRQKRQSIGHAAKGKRGHSSFCPVSSCNPERRSRPSRRIIQGSLLPLVAPHGQGQCQCPVCHFHATGYRLQATGYRSLWTPSPLVRESPSSGTLVCADQTSIH